jgi:hypothetical protein
MDKKNEYKENNFKHYQSKMLLEGDLNTKFYHTIVNNIKKKKKSIYSFEINHQIVYNSQEIKQHI